MVNTVMCTEDDFDLNSAVNLKGVWLCIKNQIQRFLDQGTGGSIVSTASITGLVSAA